MGVPYIARANATRQIEMVQKLLDMILPNRDTQRSILEFLWFGATGHQPKSMAFHWGIGYNAKTWTLELWHVTLGGYSYYGGERMFGANADSTTIANMGGRRSVIFDDLSEERPIGKAAAKAMTGNKFINARKLYSSKTEHRNCASFNFSTNTLPNLDRTDPALMRRYFPL